MIPAVLPQADMVTVSMIAAAAVEVTVVMILTAIVDPVVMIEATVATADVTAMMDMLLVGLTDMLDVMIAMAAEATSAVVVVEDTLIAMTEVVIATVDAHLEMLLQLPPMVTQLLVESQGSHMEVETMMTDIPVVAIDC